MKSKKTFIIADIHGGFRSLLQCFERSNFSYIDDHLICLGDIVDGFPETKQCIDELLKVKKLTLCLGNHDQWFLDYCLTGNQEYVWITQGGYNTLKSYENDIPKSHVEFLLKAKIYHIEGNILFVHGGIIPGTKVENNDKNTVLWDRELICSAYRKCQNRPNYRMQYIYDEIFVGHTTTGHFNKEFKPIKSGEIILIDTGGGWEGKLTIMDLDTREYWQSDYVKKLYPDSCGRKDYERSQRERLYTELFNSEKYNDHF